MRLAQVEWTEAHKKLAALMFRICDFLDLPRTLDVGKFMDQLYRNGHLSREQLREWLQVLGLTEADLWPTKKERPRWIN